MPCWDSNTTRDAIFNVYQEWRAYEKNAMLLLLDVEIKNTKKILIKFVSIYTKRMWQKAKMTSWLVCWWNPQLRHCRALDKFHSVGRHQNDDYHIHWKWIQLMNCWWCQLLRGRKKVFVLIENWIFHFAGWLAWHT